MDADQKAAVAKANEVFSQLAQDAFEKTGGDVWGNEPPPAVPEGSPPAPEEAAPAAATPTDPTPAEPTSPKSPVFGKYGSIEEAERGYFEAVRMGNLAKAEADAANIRLQVIERTVGGGTTPTSEEDPLEQMESYGMPRELMQKVVDRQVEQALDRKFTPAIRRMEADQKIVEKYPEYQTEFKAIDSFVETTPDVREQVEELNKAGNYLAARQIAFLNWKLASAQSEVAKVAETTAVRKEEKKDALMDSGVGKPRRADSHTTPARGERTPEEMKKLVDLYKAGHTTPYLRAMLDSQLPSNFDDVTAQLG
jgi:hypothetical protein